MVEFTQEIIEIVKAKFESFDIEMSEIKTRLTEIYDQPFMTQFADDNDRQTKSVMILLAQTVGSQNTYSATETLTMRIEAKEEVLAFKRKDGEESYRSNVYITAMYQDKPKFMRMTLWGDANDIHSKLIVNKIYEIPSVSNKGDTLALSTAIDIVTVDVAIPPLSEIITSDYTPIDIKEMEFNISRDWNDLKLVRGTVVGSWMKVTKNDKNMGFLKIMGDDQEEITVVKFSRGADQVMMYGSGSMVYVLGQITNATLDNDGAEVYPVGMWGNLTIPLFVIPPETEVVPGIETSETPIQKPNGSTGGFNKEDVSGW